MSDHKRNMLFALFFAFSMLYINDLNAQKQDTKGLPPEAMAWTVSALEPWPANKYKSLKEAMIDNNFFPHLVFRGGMFPKFENTFNRDSLRLTNGPPLPSPFKYNSKHVQQIFAHYLFMKSLDDMVYREVLLPDPRNFQYTIWQLPSTTIKPESIDITKNPLKIEVKATVIPPDEVDPIIKFIPDRKYWTSAFAADIKFNQNKSSVNWHKGELNNMNIYTNTNTSYNYARNKVSLTNTLITTFTLVNAPNDTLRKYTIGTDELRLNSLLGLKAIKNWNYSISGEFITSMGNKYIANTHKKQTAFLSPFTVNAGLGMTYAVNPKFKKPNRSLNLSLSLDPLSFTYKYSKDTTINLPAFFPKNAAGNYMHERKSFGSRIVMTQNARFSKSITLYSRLNYFTNYEKVECEFENKFDIILNKYFSTTIHVILRYDDGVAKKEGSDSYLQFNEIFAFGFSYRW